MIAFSESCNRKPVNGYDKEGKTVIKSRKSFWKGQRAEFYTKVKE